MYSLFNSEIVRLYSIEYNAQESRRRYLLFHPLARTDNSLMRVGFVTLCSGGLSIASLLSCSHCANAVLYKGRTDVRREL